MQSFTLEVPTAGVWWSLFDIYLVLGVLTAVVVFSILIYNVWKYREKNTSAPRDNKDRGKLGPVIIASVTLFVLFGLAYYTFGAISYMTIPPNQNGAMQIKVTAFQWGWNFTYPNGKSVLNELTVPANTTIVLNITSRDVFHSFGIPDFKVKADAIPGRYNALWFLAPQQGTFVIRCYELCGVGHSYMVGTLRVLDKQQFQQWYGVGGS